MSNQPLKSTFQWSLGNLHLAFNRLEELSHRTKPTSIPTRVQGDIEGETRIVEGFLTDFPTPILPKIEVEPTRERLIRYIFIGR